MNCAGGAPRLALLLLVLLPGPAAAGEPGVPDKDLQKRIDKAIDTGAAWLRSQQKESGRLAAVVAQGAPHYEIGATSLGGLALLAAGDKPGLAEVDRALEYCKKADATRATARTTYDTGTLLMFVSKYYAAQTPKQGHQKQGKRKSRKQAEPIELPPEVRDWVRSLATQLVETQLDTGDWGYPMGKPDFSNTQYALLGLREARDCGIPIPPQTFKKVLDRALARQAPEGPEVPRIIHPKKKGETTYVVRSKDRARGWDYQEGVLLFTGSMTTAGIAILQIANDALRYPRAWPQYKPSEQARVAQAIQDGFVWLQKNWSVTQNPGMGSTWHYYYLYGLERAGALGGRDLVGEHDWYVEGARHLVEAQKEDGRWSTGALGSVEFQASDVLDTAWAILFLARATRPMPPLPPPAVTGEEG